MDLSPFSFYAPKFGTLVPVKKFTWKFKARAYWDQNAANGGDWKLDDNQSEAADLKEAAKPTEFPSYNDVVKPSDFNPDGPGWH